VLEPVVVQPAPTQVVRYALASVAALCLDIVLTLVLHSLTPLPLYVCSGIAFISVGFVFYFVHEYWTFRAVESRASMGRLIRNLAVLALSLATRVGSIAVMEFVHPPEGLLAPVYICVGAGLSFTVNFLVNRFWVFKKRTYEG
jgi:putative flippase GtrA